MSEAKRPLENRHAVVTGAGRGIGAAVTRRLASMGASVSLIGRKPEPLQALADELAAEHGRPFHAAAADVRDAARLSEAFDGAREALGPVAVLVNNARILEGGEFLSVPLDRWEAHLDTNLMGAARATHLALPDMLENTWGRIVNLSSVSGVMGVSHVTAYAATKHGIVGFTRSLALEVVKSGITVNAVCPSYVETDMVTGLVEGLSERLSKPENVMRAA
ncbi:MAG TPA: SDR family oxidoreductase, partial [Anaeromyxobacteraceae bacterium]|nr:SDR family oxidoreductase [Anaeromyxobacteraceae bacterium]